MTAPTDTSSALGSTPQTAGDLFDEDEEGGARLTLPPGLTPGQQVLLQQLTLAAVTAYGLDDSDIQELADAIAAGRDLSYKAAYDQAAAIFKAPNFDDVDDTVSDDADPDAIDEQDNAAQQSAYGIAATYHQDLASQALQQVLQFLPMPGMGEHAAGAAAADAALGTVGAPLATNLSQWATTRADYKARQIANAETAAAADAGTRDAVDYTLSGRLLPEGFLAPDLSKFYLTVLPESAEEPLCGEWAGETFYLDEIAEIPYFPMHPNCVHEVVVMEGSLEVATSAEDDADLADLEELDQQALTDSANEAAALLDDEGNPLVDVSAPPAEETQAPPPPPPPSMRNLMGEATGTAHTRTTFRPFDVRLPTNADELKRLAQQQEDLFGAGGGVHGTKALKAHVVKQLAQRMADNPNWQAVVDALKAKDGNAAANKLVTTWAVGGSRPLIVAMQQAVRDEFALTDATLSYTKAQVKAAATKFGGDAVTQGLRAFSRAMYENAQAYLAEHGIDEVVLYRGMAWKEGKGPAGVVFDGETRKLDIALNPISSFSGTINEAYNFAKDYSGEQGDLMLVATRVPADRVLSLSMAGIGCRDEVEYTVLGGAREEVFAATGKALNEIGQYTTVGATTRDFAEASARELAAAGEKAAPAVAIDLRIPGLDPRDAALSGKARGTLLDLDRMTTSKQVRDFLRSEIRTHLDLPAPTKLDVTTLREFAKGLVRLQDQFPDAFRDLSYIALSNKPSAKKALAQLFPETKGVPPKGWMGGTFRMKDAPIALSGGYFTLKTGSGMIFDAGMFEDRAVFEAFADRAVRTGFWADGSRDMGYVVAHEFGHVLQDVLAERTDFPATIIAPKPKEVAAIKTARQAYPDLLKSAGDASFAAPISAYARSSADEYFAEAFAAQRYASDLTLRDSAYLVRQREIFDALLGRAPLPDIVAAQEAKAAAEAAARRAAKADGINALDAEAKRAAALRPLAPVADIVPVPTAAYLDTIHEAQADQVGAIARLRKTTPEAYLQRVTNHMRTMLDDASISIRRRTTSIDRFLDDGRLGTTHDAADNSYGYKQVRVDWERDAFGYPADLPNDVRPVYGYLTDAGKDFRGTEGYGEVRIILKPEVRERATMTFGDSLTNDVVVPRPVNAPLADAYEFRASGGSDIDLSTDTLDQLARTSDLLRFGTISDFQETEFVDYLEVQVHGGLRLPDVQEMEFKAKPSAALAKKLEKAGIPWHLEGEPSTVVGATTSGKGAKAAGEAEAESAERFPSSYKELSGYEAVAGPSGSQEGQWYEDPKTGERYYAKPGIDAAHAYNEVGGTLAYRVLAGLEPGRDIPEVRVLKDAATKKAYIVSKEIPGISVKTPAWWESAAAADSRTEAERAWAYDVFLSHWDVVGTGFDNLLVDADGYPVRIEAGGGMRFRAKGAEKPSWKPGGDWNEAWSLRGVEHDGVKGNWQSGVVFGGITDARAADLLAEAAATIDARLSELEAAWKDAKMPAAQTKANLAVLRDRVERAPAIEAELRGETALRSLRGPGGVEADYPLDLGTTPSNEMRAQMDRVDAAIQGNANDVQAKVELTDALLSRLKGNAEWQQVVEHFAAIGNSEYDTARQLVGQWAATSNDGDLALAMQIAAQREFKMDPAVLWHDDYMQGRALKLFGDDIPGLQAFLRAQYEATQEWFAAQGVETVRLYRGSAWYAPEVAPTTLAWDGKAAPAEIAMGPMSSWSTVDAVAYSFTSSPSTGAMGEFRAMFSADVPVERVLSVPRTGFGSLKESEAVVLGDTRDTVAVYSWNNARNPWPPLQQVTQELDRVHTEAAVAHTAEDADGAAPKMRNLVGPTGEGATTSASTRELEVGLSDARAAEQAAFAQAEATGGRDAEQAWKRMQYAREQAEAALSAARGGRGAIVHFNDYPFLFKSERYAYDDAGVLRSLTADKRSTADTFTQYFKRDVTRDEVAAMVGAPAGSYVTVYGGDTIEFTIYGAGFDPFASADQEGVAFRAERELTRSRSGVLTMENKEFFIAPEAQGQGLGTRMFTDEVNGLTDLGVKNITTHAGKSAEMNGYYTWPRLGYQGKLPDAALSKLRADVESGALPKKFSTYTKVEQLMKSSDGIAWWKANGEEIDLTFSLKPGSTSHKALDAYNAAHAQKAAAEEAERVATEALVAREARLAELPPLPSFGADLSGEAELRASDAHNSFFGPKNDKRDYLELKPVVKSLAPKVADDPAFQRLQAKLIGMFQKEDPDGLRDFRREYRGEHADASVTIETLLRQYHTAGVGDDEPFLIAIQRAVRDEFKLDTAPLLGKASARAKADKLLGDVQDGLRVFARAIYDETQAWFQAHDIEDVDLFRGMSWTPAKRPKDIVWNGTLQRVVFDLQPISSFTTDIDIAGTYTADRKYSMVVGAKVPIARIFSNPFTGLGAFGDEEVIVLGGKEGMWALPKASKDAMARAFSREELYTAFGHVPDLTATAASETEVTARQLAEGERTHEASASAAAEGASPKMRMLLGPTEDEETAIPVAIEGVTVTREPLTDSLLADAFGHDVVDAEVAQLVGALPGSNATVRAYEDGGVAHVTLTGPATRLGPASYTAERYVEVDAETGRVVVTNDHFVVSPLLRGEGVGTAIFGEQVQRLAQMGADEIRTYAMRSGTENGFYTWARLGYNHEFTPRELAKLPEQYKGVADLHALMATPGGAGWWRENGWAFSGTFELADGSASRQILDGYLATHSMTTTEERAAVVERAVDGASREVPHAAPRDERIPTDAGSAGGDSISDTAQTTGTTVEQDVFLQQLRDAIGDDITGEQHAIAVGQQIRDYLHGQIPDGFAQAVRDEARIRALPVLEGRVNPDLTADDIAWLRGERDALAAHGGAHYGNAVLIYQRLLREQTTALLQAARDLGGTDLELLTSAARHDATVAEHVTSASEVLPTEWLDASNAQGPLLVQRQVQGEGAGWYQMSRGGGDGTLALRYNRSMTDGELLTNAIHELGHRMEDAVPGLWQLERDFYERRTAGEDLVALTNGISNETRLDRWADEYVGTTPYINTRPSWVPNVQHEVRHYEIVSVGLEWVLGYDRMAGAYLTADPEFHAFILGLLFGKRGALTVPETIAENLTPKALEGGWATWPTIALTAPPAVAPQQEPLPWWASVLGASAAATR